MAQAMDPAKDRQRLICSWDFSRMAAFPGNCASRGCRLGPSRLELCGPVAYITLPVTMPSDVTCLKDRSLAVCVRFTNTSGQPQTGLIAIGLDDPNKEQHERLVFGAVNAEYDHFPYWRVDRAGLHEPRRFGFVNSQMENSINEDIHLVLVVKQDVNGGVGTYFRCYRNGRVYGNTTLCSGAATFNSDDQFAVVIKRPREDGSTVVKYAQVFGEALAEGDILRLSKNRIHLRSCLLQNCFLLMMQEEALPGYLIHKGSPVLVNYCDQPQQPSNLESNGSGSTFSLAT
jgi:hypothetical protein